MEVTFEALDVRLVNTCGKLLQTMLDAAKARGGVDLAEKINTITEARLVVHAQGDWLQVDLVMPDAAGGPVLLLGLTATLEAPVCH